MVSSQRNRFTAVIMQLLAARKIINEMHLLEEIRKNSSSVREVT